MASTGRKRHLLMRGMAQTERYKYPKEVRGSSKLRLPERERAPHGKKLQQDLANVWAQLPALEQQRRAAGIQGDRGLFLEVASEPGFDLALKSLDRHDRTQAQRHIELVAVREQANTTLATVFVPEGRLNEFERLIGDYLTKTTPPSLTAPDGHPKNRLLVESVAAIRRAVLASFWTDTGDEFPADGQSIWWEVWLRVGSDRAATVGEFRKHARQTRLRLGNTQLEFADRTVCLAYGTPAQMTSSVDLLDCIAELRKAKELASFFTEMPRSEQGEWASTMAAAIVPPRANAPAVCILDSGVTQAHPLIRPALSEDDMHTYAEAWGEADSERWHGHGTEMAGLCLHGDLTEALAGSGSRRLEHRLESVKILPPGGFPPNDRKLYGAITAYGTGLPEIADPKRRRVFALAVTTEDSRDRGLPSSWSAEIDRLAFGDEGAGQRLFVVAAGNIEEPARLFGERGGSRKG